MSVKANILRNAHGDIIVQMEGDLNFDHSIPLRREIQDIVHKNPSANVTFDLGGVDFIGSSGLVHFAETIKLVREQKVKHSGKVHVSNVSSEFRKLFRIFTLEEILEEEFDMNTDNTSDLSAQYANRRRTFEN